MATASNRQLGVSLSCATIPERMGGGDIPWFRMFRARYLTRLLLCSRARRRVDALQDSLSREQLEMLASNSPNMAEAEKFEKATAVFGRITEGGLKLGALVAFGPILTVLSLVTQKVVLPTIERFIDYLLDRVGLSGLAISVLQNKQVVQNILIFVVLVVLYTICLTASAWMDARIILTKFGVSQLERDAFAYFRIVPRPEPLVDIISLLVTAVGFASLPFWLIVSPVLFMPDAPHLIRSETIIFSGLINWSRSSSISALSPSSSR